MESARLAGGFKWKRGFQQIYKYGFNSLFPDFNRYFKNSFKHTLLYTWVVGFFFQVSNLAFWNWIERSYAQHLNFKEKFIDNSLVSWKYN